MNETTKPKKPGLARARAPFHHAQAIHELGRAIPAVIPRLLVVAIPPGHTGAYPAGSDCEIKDISVVSPNSTRFMGIYKSPFRRATSCYAPPDNQKGVCVASVFDV